MIEWLKQIDRSIVVTINSWNSPSLDDFFHTVSSRSIWIPLYMLIIFFLVKAYGWRKMFLFLLLTAAVAAIADLSSVFLFKEAIRRYRPSHNLYLHELLHYYRNPDGTLYLGGQYGFVSSHATNFAVLVTLVGLSMKRDYPNLVYWLTGITILVCYSRMYLGVHYFTDIAGGLIWGSLIGFIAYLAAGRKLLSN